MKISCFYIPAIILLLLQSCSPGKRSLPSHEVKFFNGSTNNKLEVLDWGGSGKPLLFLTGLGSSAHIYDSFAPAFTDKFHVYALTRRGFGASANPGHGYDASTLAQDIIAVLDSLGIQKVTVIGHSVAGQEINKLASTYPDRMAKVIYLDAAFDYTAFDMSLYANMPKEPQATALDSSSLEHIKNYWERTVGIPIAEEEVRSIGVFADNGKFMGDVTPDTVVQAMMQVADRPDYAHIQCPALAIYSSPDSVQTFMAFYDELDSVNRKKADYVFAGFSKLAITEQNKFKSEIPNGIVKIIKGSHHYVFISHPAETEKMIREFLE